MDSRFNYCAFKGSDWLNIGSYLTFIPPFVLSFTEQWVMKSSNWSPSPPLRSRCIWTRPYDVSQLNAWRSSTRLANVSSDCPTRQCWLNMKHILSVLSSSTSPPESPQWRCAAAASIKVIAAFMVCDRRNIESRKNMSHCPNSYWSSSVSRRSKPSKS